MSRTIRAQHLVGTGLIALCLLAACDAGAGEADRGLTSTEALLQESSDELPPGHPPLSGGDMVVPPPPAGSGTGASGLTWEVPAAWIEESPTSAMRRAQYRLPGESGDGECVVFYFGPGQGGDATANALRWADQFTQPDGSSSREALTTEEVSTANGAALLVEITGTYSGGMAMGGRQPQPQPGAMLLGAIVPGPDANWFFKCTGPEATLNEHRSGFRALIDSLRPAGEIT